MKDSDYDKAADEAYFFALGLCLAKWQFGFDESWPMVLLYCTGAFASLLAFEAVKGAVYRRRRKANPEPQTYRDLHVTVYSENAPVITYAESSNRLPTDLPGPPE